ncbi:N-acetylmuramoyl-L-alanine amidase CwlD [Desmospora activa]|uniref:N-acetylmuramoyl-L-alanine amidase n=1 Tax=Desmospora activa DSM 45169 TaxID=1121389 RepID=A0A2T4Z1N1_9BACL|nr:N-acetylmuramoyl-L-alanine amidase CwlD [Desmospora activa]PTM54648.1 N-acetylmuramoyl-L-alanine amidase [Desmospora activa DSM 45169]
MDQWKEWISKRSPAFWVLSFLLLLAAATSVLAWWTGSASQDAWSMPLSGKIIVVDPGHGGRDGGAVSRDGLVEKEVTLAIALQLRDYLQEAGALVIMTRETDRDLADDGARKRKAQDLYRRAQMVKENDADLFISIHLNAVPSPRWSGAQTFYYPTLEDNELLAGHIQNELVRNLENTKRKERHSGEIYILKTSSVPSALVEVGFLSNPEEASRLAQEPYQNLLATSIYHGVISYLVEKETEEEGSL